MSRTEQKFTPVSELDGATIERGKRAKTTIIFDFNALPNYHNPGGTTLKQQIGMNVAAIRRRCLVGDIAALRIEGKSGKTSEFSVVPVGSNPDGTAIGGQVAVKKRVLTFDTADDGDVATIQLNISEIEQRMKRKNKPARSAAEWSHYLNTALELSFLKQQLDRIKIVYPPPNVANILVQSGFLTFNAISYPNVAYWQGYIYGGLQVFYAALKRANPILNRTQIFPLERSLSSIALGLKDPFLGTQSLVRKLPEKGKK